MSERFFEVRHKRHLMDAALAQIMEDVQSNDLTAIYGLLNYVPDAQLYSFLSDAIRYQLDAIVDDATKEEAIKADARACGEDDEPELTIIKLGQTLSDAGFKVEGVRGVDEQ